MQHGGMREAADRNAAREAAAERTDHEYRDPGHEHTLPAKNVAQPAGGNNTHGHGEDVGVGYPLQIGQPRVEIALDSRQRHIDDRHVKKRDKEPKTHGNQGPPFVTLGWTCRVTCRHSSYPPSPCGRSRNYYMPRALPSRRYGPESRPDPPPRSLAGGR